MCCDVCCVFIESTSRGLLNVKVLLKTDSAGTSGTSGAEGNAREASR
jgi:hypothetical protein